MFVVVFLLFIISTLSYFFLDKVILNWILAQHFEVKFVWFKYITIFGEGAIYLTIIPVLWFFNRHKKLLAEKYIYIWSVLFSCNFLALIIKISLGRARPYMFISQNLYGLYGFTLDSNFWSLPSGHTITIFALLLTTSIVFTAWRNFLIFFTILIIISRLVLLKHYLSDVLFAITLDYIIFYCLNRIIFNQKYLPSLLKYIESNPKILARFLLSK
jgi:membrane-associated phospholipid phosphatase